MTGDNYALAKQIWLGASHFLCCLGDPSIVGRFYILPQTWLGGTTHLFRVSTETRSHIGTY